MTNGKTQNLNDPWTMRKKEKIMKNTTLQIGYGPDGNVKLSCIEHTKVSECRLLFMKSYLTWNLEWI